MTNHRAATGMKALAGLASLTVTGCGGYTDVTGGDFSKETITEIAAGYRDEAQAPQPVTGGAAGVRFQAQSTTYLSLDLEGGLVGAGTTLAVTFRDEERQVLTSNVANADEPGFDLSQGADGVWHLRVYPGMSPVAEQLSAVVNALTIVVTEPQIADSGEGIIVTRTADLDVTVVDFDVAQPGLLAGATGANTLAGWGSVYAQPVANAGGSDFLDADFAAIVHEPN